MIQTNKFNPISRADIAVAPDEPHFHHIITSLMELDLIKQEEAFSKGVGRNGINICINKDAFLSLDLPLTAIILK